ncbi:tetratricopeptide repeat protein [Nocardia sp. NPDC051052]|uniref:tetratricopeptide repeat protein n=1 Tax=Nocardia sp. NPDC051052 TaxID=3364322 RepID=UPI0037A6B590
MRTEFLRAATAVGHQTHPGTLSRALLGAYFDLTDEHGPIHARGVADAGRHLLAGTPIPAYQINTASLLRAALVEECGTGDPHDPTAVPPGARSARWTVLCDLIDEWPTLADTDRLRVAAVLSKLGCWQAVVRLVSPKLPVDQSDCAARLALLRCNALFKSADRDTAVTAFHQAQRIMASTAQHPGYPLDLRLSAAIGLVVHHAKSDKTLTVIDGWATTATQLLRRADRHTVAPVTASAYWRGVSFVPYLRHDFPRMQQMLGAAEDAARAALIDTGTDALLARENLHPLLETRARAWMGVGNAEAAEQYYRELVTHDPLDPKVHVRLGDFLLHQSRLDEARSAYEHAALLGAPYTSYAFTQAARCSLHLDEPERGIASLMHAVRIDARSITPLVELRRVAGPAGFSSVAAWAADRLDTLAQQAARPADHPPSRSTP